MLQISIRHKSLQNAQKRSAGLTSMSLLTRNVSFDVNYSKIFAFCGHFWRYSKLEVFASHSSHILVCLVAKSDSNMPKIRFLAKF